MLMVGYDLHLHGTRKRICIPTLILKVMNRVGISYLCLSLS
jgi:hypothetical protein